MAHQDDGFLREVEEELRRERLEKIWRQYGTYILIGAAAHRLRRARLQVFGEQAHHRRPGDGRALRGCARRSPTDGKEGSADARSSRSIAADGTGGYPALARLQLAGALPKDGKKADALAAYEALAKDGRRRRAAARLCGPAGRRPAARRGRLYGDAESAQPFDGRREPLALQCARAAGPRSVQGGQGRARRATS